MPFEKGNEMWKRRKKHGRDGFGLEEKKKYILHKAFDIEADSLEQIDNKFRKRIAHDVVLSEFRKNIDITSGGEKILVLPKEIINKNGINTEPKGDSK